MNRGCAALLSGLLAGFVPAALASEEPDPAAPKGGATIAAGSSRAAASEILALFDAVQKDIRSLSADFSETTENPLLREPILARGRFYLTKPGSILWEYDAPEVMRFAVTGEEYVGYFPERKRAERRSVRRWSAQLFRFFGLGQATGELSRFYDIRVESGPDAGTDAFLLVLEPRRRRVRDRVEQVRLWVDRRTLLPRQVVYIGAEGYRRTIRFRNVRTNPELAASLFRLEIPVDVTITTGLSAFGAPARPR